MTVKQLKLICILNIKSIYLNIILIFFIIFPRRNLVLVNLMHCRRKIYKACKVEKETKYVHIFINSTHCNPNECLKSNEYPKTFYTMYIILTIILLTMAFTLYIN